MRYSKLFTKTLKEAPADETAKNAQLLIRAGFIHKEMAGVYQLLPLGLRVIENIKQIVREEMEAVDMFEMVATTLQSREVWERTTRWDDTVVDVWFKSKLKSGVEVGLAWSHEEPLANMLKSHIHNYKDLPVYLFQFQNKLRNELRSKSGMMRGREFMMKDGYSFCATEEQHELIYEACKVAYKNCFDRMGVGKDTYITFASGGAFTEFSHEFQTICEAGEDITYIDREKGLAVNEEVLEKVDFDELGVKRDDLVKFKTAEVGNIFNFGRGKAEDVGLFFDDENGKKTAVWIGSYGLGITRMMGVMVEKLSDERGIVWPESVAPFKYHLVTIARSEDDESYQKSQELYEKLIERGDEVLWDDRIGVRPGEKFADADLIGCPIRLVVSPKNVETGKVEVKKRNEEESKMLDFDKI
ncbi:prolyl-tRNA synthetase [Candidatus Saccharibacteria bacterium]|nr:prolyl-tRNA synthetase [Candidatus Saccharibacteria bacterium]